MAGQSPCQVFRRDRDRARGQIGLRWPTLWDSPPVTYHLQGGSLGTLPGPRSSGRSVCSKSWTGQREGAGLEAENRGLRRQNCHVSLCDPGNSPDPGSLGRWGADRSLCIWGRKGGAEPLPHQGCLNPGCRRSCCSLFPRSCCLSVSMATRPKAWFASVQALELTSELGFSASFWKPVHWHSQEPPTASSSHCVGGTLGQLEKAHYLSFINLIPLERGKAALGPMAL